MLYTESAILLGYEEFTSKNGLNCVLAHFTKTINKRDTHIVCTGSKSVSFFVSDNLKSKISANDVGKELTICIHWGKDNYVLDDIIR